MMFTVIPYDRRRYAKIHPHIKQFRANQRAQFRISTKAMTAMGNPAFVLFEFSVPEHMVRISAANASTPDARPVSANNQVSITGLRERPEAS